MCHRSPAMPCGKRPRSVSREPRRRRRTQRCHGPTSADRAPGWQSQRDSSYGRTAHRSRPCRRSDRERQRAAPAHHALRWDPAQGGGSSHPRAIARAARTRRSAGLQRPLPGRVVAPTQRCPPTPRDEPDRGQGRGATTEPRRVPPELTDRTGMTQARARRRGGGEATNSRCPGLGGQLPKWRLDIEMSLLDPTYDERSLHIHRRPPPGGRSVGSVVRASRPRVTDRRRHGRDRSFEEGSGIRSHGGIRGTSPRRRPAVRARTPAGSPPRRTPSPRRR